MDPNPDPDLDPDPNQCIWIHNTGLRRCGGIRRCGGLVVSVPASRSPGPGSNLGPGPPHSVA